MSTRERKDWRYYSRSEAADGSPDGLLGMWSVMCFMYMHVWGNWLSRR